MHSMKINGKIPGKVGEKKKRQKMEKGERVWMEKAHKRWTPLTIMASRTSCPPAQCSLTLTSVVSR